jgi:STE24 endopeptidase
MFREFGFHDEMPILIGFFLFSEVLGPTECVMQLVMNAMTRSFEYQAGKLDPHMYRFCAFNWHDADAFAFNLGYKTELAQALIKLQIKNLSAMDADYLYSSYHYSHPILPERLQALGWDGTEKVSKDEDSEKPVKASGRDDL